MSTYDERWVQADRHARVKADHAYELGVDNAEKASLYYGAYHTEMHAFKQLEAMRKPLPNQAEIDAASARILKDPLTSPDATWEQLGRGFTEVEPECPECALPAPTGRCAHCQGE